MRRGWRSWDKVAGTAWAKSLARINGCPEKVNHAIHPDTEKPPPDRSGGGLNLFSPEWRSDQSLQTFPYGKP